MMTDPRATKTTEKASSPVSRKETTATISSPSPSSEASVAVDSGASTGTPSPSTTTSATTASTSNKKCVKCSKRMARDGCTQLACLTCCTDTTLCVVHAKAREQVEFKQLILTETTPIQILLKQLKSSALPKGRFHDKSFHYLNDTITIWNVEQYLLGNTNSSASSSSKTEGVVSSKHRDDAIRKSLKRRRQRNDEHNLVTKVAAKTGAKTNNGGRENDNDTKRVRKLSRQERFRRILNDRLEKQQQQQQQQQVDQGEVDTSYDDVDL